jgi:hypothetical protein
MSLKEYVVTAKSMDDLESLYNDLETAGGTATIPDRAVPVYRRRPISQCTHYMLTDEEAVKLNNDSRILNVEPMELILGSIKLNSYKQTGTFSKTTYLTGMNASWKNWALLRCLEGVQRSNWGDNGTATQTATIDVGPTGKNVDVIIIDGMCGVPDHPEFAVNADGTGGTRYVQYNWYQLNSIVSSIDDDAATLLTGNYSYSAAADVGNANHGAHTAGTALYRYKETGEHRKTTSDYEGYDYTKWDKFDVIGNKYNRLVIYRGDLFHASLDYFGNNPTNCRLFQTFFFNTLHY